MQKGGTQEHFAISTAPMAIPRAFLGGGTKEEQTIKSRNIVPVFPLLFLGGGTLFCCFTTMFHAICSCVPPLGR